MLEIGMKDVTKNYGFKNVLSGISLEIMTGDHVALIGRNGTGKTTLLKIISGEEKESGGSVTVRKGAKIGYLQQIPALLSRDVTVSEVLLEPFSEVLAVEKRMRELERRLAAETDDTALQRLMRSYAHQQSQFEALGGYAVQEELARFLTGFRLTELEDRPFNVLSGGQKTIVCLARTMLSKPDILLLDEPTNHLDMETLSWFEAYLAAYRGTVVAVSHDRYFLDAIARKTLIIDGGTCTLYHGNYTFSQKEREKDLLIEFEQYKNQQKKIAAMRAAIKRFRDWGTQADNKAMFVKAKMLERRLEKMEMLDRPELEKRKLPITFSGGQTGREVIRLQGVALSAGGLPLLKKASLTVYYRERVCLMGANGTGKTTLLRTILGEHPFDSGEVFITPRASIGYIPQEIRFESEQATVLDAFRAGFVCTEGEARTILAQAGFFGEHVFKRAASLSGGEKVLLKLLILVRNNINLLILDEPTNHIDIETREMLEEALLSFQGTILFVSHDRYFINKLADRRFVIDRGTITEVLYTGKTQ